jgi:hypothetical protein
MPDETPTTAESSARFWENQQNLPKDWHSDIAMSLARAGTQAVSAAPANGRHCWRP